MVKIPMVVASKYQKTVSTNGQSAEMESREEVQELSEFRLELAIKGEQNIMLASINQINVNK